MPESPGVESTPRTPCPAVFKEPGALDDAQFVGLRAAPLGRRRSDGADARVRRQYPPTFCHAPHEIALRKRIASTRVTVDTAQEVRVFGGCVAKYEQPGNPNVQGWLQVERAKASGLVLQVEYVGKESDTKALGPYMSEVLAGALGSPIFMPIVAPL